ncbi:CU044_5270 family protein [Kitasatospora sp. NPDC056651]|uniref:CU044_5270 family protein n=1 Tax=Kitasatospora sp. NPDC056651 TaxID=3345892 RepID=UPI0036CC4C36
MNATPRRGTQDPAEAPERRELAELLRPPTVPGLAADRRALLREELLREAAALQPHRAPERRPAWYRSPVRIAVPALAAALAIVGAVVVDLNDPTRQGRSAAGAGAAGASEAALLLDRIALAAAGSEQPAVRADQFVYIESTVAYAAQSAGGGPVTMAPAHTRRVWLSADGSRPGLLREEGGPDTPLREDGPVLHLDQRGAAPRPGSARPGGPSIGDPTHAYVASLPTDPDALLKLIRDETRGGAGGAEGRDQRAFTAIGDLLAETWAPPQVGAALYRAAERIPGVTVVPSATDAAGREGVAVARTAHGRQTQWVFDRTTYAFLGERTVVTGAGAEVEAEGGAEAGDAGPAVGTVLGSSAVLTRAAVDRAGELPPAPR